MKRRIAVLGGGCGAMAAVWALTHLPDWENRFDITVYQLGWRLGGKGSSGRDEKTAFRILEHGLHVWGGFYENAFRMMRQCYDELPPDPNNPLRTWDAAFKKQSAITLQECIGGRTVAWNFDYPENNLEPGSGGTLPTPVEYLPLLAGFINDQISRYAFAIPHQLLAHVRVQLATAKTLLSRLTPSLRLHMEPQLELLRTLEAPVRWLRDKAANLLSGNDPVRRILILLDVFQAIARGMLLDGVLFRGFEVINAYDWREWLQRHGASPSTLDSAIVRCTYDYVFGYVHGRTEEPAFEAGTALHGMMRLLFTYKGAIFWEMQAGMGETVFAPLYLVLARRGVKFRFFHRVLELGVSTDGKYVERLEMQRQATLKQGEYKPLIRVKGIPCWPAQPLYKQLVEGPALKYGGVDLESTRSTWQGETLTLRRGQDFDDVVLAIAIGAHRDIAREVMASAQRFRDMVEHVQTIQTGSMQLWLDVDAMRLGAPPFRRVATACAHPLSTWADLSFLLEREQWLSDAPPRFLAYFCGPLEDGLAVPSIHQLARQWLENNIETLWPDAVSEDGHGLDWNLLHDPLGRKGPERLRAQYIRANTEPSDRYVTSFPGTSKYRLGAGESGLDNLYLAGDWTRTSFNSGCVEAAVISGLQAAQAIGGETIDIIEG
ncbi:FAD-dependent oxidoreductase [Archangium violaceum]|uniref:Amine oxidase domain-containing protein n=1 Tax=Archangium violaceum Cb vi76 TaxID=1406225 RepID=A0A084SV90_9BACT|nr:FAD-dependent oxidoreductase [Archangium violaceum]KFA92375.1 hypothetical protein Q664_15965 [Archangium violaceum Cb vi76]